MYIAFSVQKIPQTFLQVDLHLTEHDIYFILADILSIGIKRCLDGHKSTHHAED